jgi:eukaryotic-like serine/threonine-protein kinase
MPLSPGSTLGSYDIVAPLGAGGMGEVYRARDRTLNREVAIKVLPAGLANDPASLARFEREAQAVAALSHPNILAIHDFRTDAGVAYAVTELLEGDTLRARLADGALPVRKAIEIGIGVARGIAAAHGRGFVHRDLKPENIFITTEGMVKILDFGLAKAAAPDLHAAGQVTAGGAETRLAVGTTPGTVMGTVGYMAPEQVRGAEVDARTDLFALGAVLYEMLSGAPPFRRDTAAETMTAILKEDPPEFAPLPGITPALDRIVRHCLEKQPSERFQTARDVAFALEALTGSSPSGSSMARDLPAPEAGRLVAVERIGWTLLALVLAGYAGWSALAGAKGALPDAVRRATVLLPEGQSFRPGMAPARRLALSPDGRRIAVALAPSDSGASALYVHSLESGAGTPVVDSVPASAPFWSPDGEMLGFFQDNRLMTVEAAGGRPTRRAAGLGYAAWSPAGDMLDISARSVRLLARTSSDWREVGGAPLDVPGAPIYPVWLPGGERFLVLWGTQGGQTAELYIGSVAGTAWRHVGSIDMERESINLAYAAGHLIFVRDQMLVARAIDLDAPALGQDVIVLAGPVVKAARGSATFAVSETVLVFEPVAADVHTRLVWYDRTGARLSQVGDDAMYSNLELSPDGTQLLVGVVDPATRNQDQWVVDLRRGVRSRLTADPADERSGSWFPDGSGLVFRGQGGDLYARPLGAGTVRPVQVDGRSKDPRGFSPDGQYLIYRRSGQGTSNDIWIKPMQPEGDPRPLIASSFNEGFAEISPDGRWLAYESDESGEEAVYVTAFPTATGKVRVHPGAGELPRWRRDGRELFYLTPDRVLMGVSVSVSGSTFEVGAPAPLFQTDADRAAGPQYVVSADGQRFLINSKVPTTERGTLSLVFNWQGLLRPRAAAGR